MAMVFPGMGHVNWYSPGPETRFFGACFKKYKAARQTEPRPKTGMIDNVFSSALPSTNVFSRFF